jgi:hypothetical protein
MHAYVYYLVLPRGMRVFKLVRISLEKELQKTKCPILPTYIKRTGCYLIEEIASCFFPNFSSILLPEKAALKLRRKGSEKP